MVTELGNETEVFLELDKLCSSVGYAHVIAYFCFKSNIVSFEETVKPEDFLKLYSDERLSHTEISTLIGLMMKNDVDLTLPKPEEMQRLIECTDSVLRKLHNYMTEPMFKEISKSINILKDTNAFKNATTMREPIFYGSDSAYSFQYLDFSIQKYSKDNGWIKKEKGFYIEEAKEIIECIDRLQREKLSISVQSFEDRPIVNKTVLPAFIFTAEEIAKHTCLSKDTIISVLEAFTMTYGKCNQRFNAINDYNEINAKPLIKIENRGYLLFQAYSICEALYESPYYWFLSDKDYINTAMENRGVFTEQFSKERLETVFEKSRVYSNIIIGESRSKALGEIDVLVIFANRAIILQAKSKKLTIEARKGNDEKLKEDFKMSIQDSYDQALLCSCLIMDDKNKLFDINDNAINIKRDFKEIYIFCVVSDHYPALCLQTHSFLSYEKSKIIMPPYVMDVFILDVLAEMLDSPIYFLSYINRRAQYYEKIIAESELTILSYHLSNNLWLNDKYSQMYLEDDFCTDLDTSMLVRRRGYPGNDIPDGILTSRNNSILGKLIRDIERYENPGSIDLGFFLLKLGKYSIEKMNESISMITNRAKDDGNHHDFTLLFDDITTGLTIHSNRILLDTAKDNLLRHCEIKKYSQKAKKWFGICLDPNSRSPRVGIALDYNWEWSTDMDDAVLSLSTGLRVKCISDNKEISDKVGRNDPCPCGSGIKYKKCCLNRNDCNRNL